VPNERSSTLFGPSNLVELVRFRAHHQSDDLAFAYLADGDDERIDMTYGELDRHARTIGAWLQSKGLAGQRALLLYPPGLEFITAFFGCLYAGAVAVPVYPPRRNRSLDRIQAVVQSCDAKAALTTQVVKDRVAPLIDETPELREFPWLASCDAPKGVEEQWEKPSLTADTLAFLQYTSGSTGTPKGVMLSHGNLVHNSWTIQEAFEHTRTGLGVFWLPSYHDMGLIGGILQPLWLGRPNILMSPLSFLQKPVRWLKAITKYQATTSGGPNFAFDLCVRQIAEEELENLDLSSWKVAFNGAEPVRPETIEKFTKKFAPCGFQPETFYPCFGLAEATLLVTGGYVSEKPIMETIDADLLAEGRAVIDDGSASKPRRVVSSGRSLVDETVVIADPEGMTTKPEAVVGEIWAKGPSMAKGYWGNQEATDYTFGAYLKDTGEGPFMRTGDLGYMRNGELFVTGRIKDLIILRGVNIYPQDIEKTAEQSHESLRPNGSGAFVIEESGAERLIIVMEVERRYKGEYQPLFDAVYKSVARDHEMALDTIVFVKAGSIPKTSSGKIQRHACRNSFLNGSLRSVAQWQPGATAAGDDPAAARKRTPVKRKIESDTSGAFAALSESAQDSHLKQAGGTPEVANATSGEQPTEKASFAETAKVVLEEVQNVARERAVGLTIETDITEMGLDSLERMEILATLEERFGGRFPEEILPDILTCRDVVEAVRRYLGSKPRVKTERPADFVVPEDWYKPELFPEYKQLRQGLDFLDATGLSHYFDVHESLTNDKTIVDGKELVNWSSYNYVGMSGEPEIVEAAQEACAKYGTSVSASRLVAGEKDLHVDLEREISEFLGTEDTIVMVGGHSTNESVIGHLLAPGDLILHDSLAHNSIMQGAILSGARRRPFKHNDWEEADRILTNYRHEYRRVMIIIEGVYSMDGDFPDLPKFIELKKKHNALLMIDEAHSIGVLGETGRGIGEEFDVDRKDVDVWMCTLSKTFASCGGYISGSKQLVEYLKYTTPGFVFSVGLSPPNAAAALAALRLLNKEPERVEQLRVNSRLFLDLAIERGLDTGMCDGTPVVPVIIGNSIISLKLSRALFLRGINVLPILHPAVEEKAARLRFFITSCHTEEEIRTTVNAVAEELEKLRAEEASAE
jgi:8-amino-7-oxononanoate synthase